MQINSRQLRQIIREELMLLTEQSVLSGYKQPVPAAGGTQVTIETQPPATPPGTAAPAPRSRSATSKKLGVRVITTVFGKEVDKILDISNLSITSWNPDAPDGQPFMTVSFKVGLTTKTGVGLKNKQAFDNIAKAVLNRTRAEGEMMLVDPADPDGPKAALIVNY